MRAKHIRFVALSILGVLAATFCGAAPASAQDDKAAKTESPANARKSRAKTADRPSGRLPIYYAKIVDDKQKTEIYRIQQEYKPKLVALKAQMDALTKEQDTKIAALLTPEQQKKLSEAKAAAARSRSGANAEKKPEAQAPAPPVATPEK
jgi:hypothetical protein